MKLTDIMGHADLSTYPEIGLVIFLVVFVSIVWRVLRPSAAARAALEQAANLPLEELEEGKKR